MGVDAICNVLILESHIAVAQNGYETHSCVTWHTNMYCTQSKSHCVNSVINIHTIHFLYRNGKQKNAPCERALSGIVVTGLPHHFVVTKTTSKFDLVPMTSLLVRKN